MPDFTTDAGKVRLLISDLGEPPILSEEMIQGFLGMQPVVKLAAADALDAIASSEALLSKKLKTQDREADGPAVAAALRAHAKNLRDQAASEAAEDDGYFGVVEFEPYPRWW